VWIQIEVADNDRVLCVTAPFQPLDAPCLIGRESGLVTLVHMQLRWIVNQNNQDYSDSRMSDGLCRKIRIVQHVSKIGTIGKSVGRWL
jgi:hypothetical protein